jgi:hypothetical protein
VRALKITIKHRVYGPVPAGFFALSFFGLVIAEIRRRRIDCGPEKTGILPRREQKLTIFDRGLLLATDVTCGHVLGRSIFLCAG